MNVLWISVDLIGNFLFSFFYYFTIITFLYYKITKRKLQTTFISKISGLIQVYSVKCSKCKACNFFSKKLWS